MLRCENSVQILPYCSAFTIELQIHSDVSSRLKEMFLFYANKSQQIITFKTPYQS